MKKDTIKNFLFKKWKLSELLAKFVVYICEQLALSFPFNLLKPLGEKFPDDLHKYYVPPNDD